MANWLRNGLLVLTAATWAFASCDVGEKTTLPTRPHFATGGGGGEAGAEAILCDKYGGPDGVAAIVTGSVVPGLLDDCALAPFFANLPPDEQTRFSDCMVIEFQTLFECAGVSYAGAHASNGLACRSLSDAHQGLGVSAGDFSAFGRALVTSLRAAGVAQSDIDVIGAKLLGTQPAIVSDPGNTSPTRDGGCPQGGNGGQAGANTAGSGGATAGSAGVSGAAGSGGSAGVAGTDVMAGAAGV